MFLSPAVLAEGFAQALGNCRSHPLRASLAGLAMAAAVATTAVVQTGLNGLARSAREAGARAFGSDAFVLARVTTGTLSRRELVEKLARHPNITRADVRFLERYADGRLLYAATAQRAADVAAGGRRFEAATISGTQAALFEIRDVGIARGRPFTEDEEIRGAQVIVAGHGVVEALFPALDPLEQSVRIAGRAFRIIGIQAPQGSGSGVSLDRFVWMPIGAFERAFGAPDSVQVFARAVDVTETGEAEDHARVSMRARRQLQPSAADTFDVITPEASRSFVAAITERLGDAGPPISLMALLAAIVVVANTTLVSVTQRMREIGVRRAVGARRAHVLAETVAESVLMSAAGGCVGLAAAAAALAAAPDVFGFPLSLAWPTVAWSLAAAGLSGLAAGWYPARRAMRITVTDALRQE